MPIYTKAISLLPKDKQEKIKSSYSNADLIIGLTDKIIELQLQVDSFEEDMDDLAHEREFSDV